MLTFPPQLDSEYHNIRDKLNAAIDMGYLSLLPEDSDISIVA